MNPVNHTRFIVACITGLSAVFALAGALLLLKGFQGGELLVGGATTGLGALAGALTTRPQAIEPPKLVPAKIEGVIQPAESNP